VARVFAERVAPRVARLVLAHPQRIKAIASAKLKNDRVDSATLAHLLRSELLPENWMADASTQALRARLRRRIALVEQRTRWKNQLHGVLHHVGRHSPHSDLFGISGRHWLAELALQAAEREAVDTALRLIDAIDEQIGPLEQQIRQWAWQDPAARAFASIPGVGTFTALVLKAEIGEIHRFKERRQLYSYAGLVPRVRESADHHWRGAITRAGSRRLRWVMVEAAMNAARNSPAARAYF
jgi:transposase